MPCNNPAKLKEKIPDHIGPEVGEDHVTGDAGPVEAAESGREFGGHHIQAIHADLGKKERAAAANEWMMNDGLIPRMVAGYGLPDHLRITIGTESEVRAVKESLARFVAAGK